jgi:hypothetical protein
VGDGFQAGRRIVGAGGEKCQGQGI